eukprot:scaffold139321_cov41-Tisochrysis_lutea.AAC.1
MHAPGFGKSGNSYYYEYLSSLSPLITITSSTSRKRPKILSLLSHLAGPQITTTLPNYDYTARQPPERSRRAQQSSRGGR